jgi:hypothetical protein
MKMKKSIAVLSVLIPAAMAVGQVDNVVTIVPAAIAVGGVPSPSPLAAFGYDPINDRIYVAGFSNGDQELRRIDNVSAGAGTFQTQVFATSWLRYGRDNDLTLGGGSPTPSAILLNPLPINLAGGGSLAAYSTAAITDAAGLVQMGSGAGAVRFPEKTKKLYTYNLQQSVGPIATDVFTTRVTVADLQTAVGVPSTETSNNFGRQPAWSGDGQSIYFIDSGSTFGGLWKIGAAGGAPARILADTDVNTEPAVTTSAGVDTVYFRGGGATGNLNGIDKVTHDGTTTSARTVHVSAAAMADFFEQTTSDLTSFSMTSDSAGNVYFNNTATARRGVFKVDPQGRIAKVLGYEDRRAAFNGAGAGNPNSNTLRMQPRTTSFGTGSSAFAVTQILYNESSATNFAGANQIAGAYIFKTGDFDRDNDVDQTDIAAFKSALTLKAATPLSGTVVADQPKLRFDLNANNVVSYKDVKILQQFYVFPDGDADINKTVNLDDFTSLAANFGLSGKKWTEGDFTGDESVTLDDFTILAANFGLTSPADQARAVPEPAAFAVGAIVCGLILNRRLRH